MPADGGVACVPVSADGENLTYFLNHAFPVMYPGMGATADYMTLENGDLVELGMFTSGEFYTDE